MLLAVLLHMPLAGGQPPQHGVESAANNVAFDPRLLTPVEDRTAELRPGERELMLQVLDHAGRIDYDRQASAAASLLAERREQMPESARRPDTEVLIEDLLRIPDYYRGRPVTLTGYVRRVSGRDLEENRYGIGTVYEFRLFTEAGDSSPAEVISLSLPENWPGRGQVIDDVSVTGYFFKLSESVDGSGGEAALAPVILARRVEWNPVIEPGEVRLDESLWKQVEHKRPVTDRERVLYYRVLKHARDTDFEAQQAEARRTLRFRIEQYRRDAEAEYDELQLRAERYLQNNPSQQDAYERRIERAARQYRRKLRNYQRFRERPGEFPTYVDLFKNYESYVAQPVSLRGRLRQLVESPADEKIRYRFDRLYEAWIYTEDSQNHPSVVVCTSVPEALMRKARQQGDKLDEPVAMTGYFFKMYAYRAHDTERFAPMFLAQRIQRRPVPEEPEPIPAAYVYVPLLLIVAAVLGFVWKTRREDRRHRARLQGRQPPATEPDLAQFAVTENPQEVSFEGVEAAEEPHFRDYGRPADTGGATRGTGTKTEAGGSWLFRRMLRSGGENGLSPRRYKPRAPVRGKPRR